MTNIVNRTKNILLICMGAAAALLISACTGSLAATNLTDPVQPVSQKISPDEAMTWLESDDPPLLLDVRTVEENQASRIPGDFLIPIDQLANRIDEIPIEKNQPIIVYCRSGNRSAHAANILIDAGFTRVYDLGGIISWPYETEFG